MTVPDRNRLVLQETKPWQIRLALLTEQPLLEALIASCNLPLAGFTAGEQTTLVAATGEKLSGCVALELYGSSALLRSLAVDAAQRGHGLGRELLAAGAALAQRQGATTLYLLTTTAAPFFEKLGWNQISRAEVPQAVTASVEFQGACPESATVYRLTLPESPPAPPRDTVAG